MKVYFFIKSVTFGTNCVYQKVLWFVNVAWCTMFHICVSFGVVKNKLAWYIEERWLFSKWENPDFCEEQGISAYSINHACWCHCWCQGSWPDHNYMTVVYATYIKYVITRTRILTRFTPMLWKYDIKWKIFFCCLNMSNFGKCYIMCKKGIMDVCVCVCGWLCRHQRRPFNPLCPPPPLTHIMENKDRLFLHIHYHGCW